MFIMHIVNISSVNLNLLVVLDALLAERNVTRAATRIGLSQPAVSHALAQLREIFGDPLLVRGACGMTPTERAIVLAPTLREALRAVERTFDPPAAFDPTTAKGTITIAASDFVGFVLGPPLVARLAREAPGLNIVVRPWSWTRIPPGLESGEIDLMLGFMGKLPPGFHKENVFRDRFVCVVRRRHPVVTGDRVSLATYVKLGHVLVSSETAGPGVVDEALAKRGLSRRVALRVPHFLIVPHVLATTDLVAALSERVARPFARTLPLRLLPPPLPLPEDHVVAVWHERTQGSPMRVWLREVVREVARKLDGGASPGNLL